MKASSKPAGGDYEAVSLPIWQELLVGVELVYLRISPVYWGFGVPHGDGSAVVVIPGFMMNDLYLTPLRTWLRRIGYRPYDSRIGINADCPNLLMRWLVDETVARAYAETGRKVHLIGHSLGGLLARAAAREMPDRVASVITLGAPFGGISAHPSIVRAAEVVRQQILQRHGDDVLPACYTGKCTCDFLESLEGKLPRSVQLTSVYTKTDGIVEWRACRTGNPRVDFEVSATHIGLVYSPLVYSLLAERLARVNVRKETSRGARANAPQAIAATPDTAPRGGRQRRRAI